MCNLNDILCAVMKNNELVESLTCAARAVVEKLSQKVQVGTAVCHKFVGTQPCF